MSPGRQINFTMQIEKKKNQSLSNLQNTKWIQASQIQSLFLAAFVKLVDAHVIMLWEISGSGPLGRGLASQHVCSATLPGSLPACCMVITYELGVEEVDGQDVNRKKKNGPKQRLPVDERNKAANGQQK